MKINGILLAGNAGEKKDGSGKKYLMVSVLFDSSSLQKAKVHQLFAGAEYVGNYDLTGFNVFDKVEIEYEQPFGSQYIKLVDIKKVK